MDLFRLVDWACSLPEQLYCGRFVCWKPPCRHNWYLQKCLCIPSSSSNIDGYTNLPHTVWLGLSGDLALLLALDTFFNMCYIWQFPLVHCHIPFFIANIVILSIGFQILWSTWYFRKWGCLNICLQFWKQFYRSGVTAGLHAAMKFRTALTAVSFHPRWYHSNKMLMYTLLKVWWKNTQLNRFPKGSPDLCQYETTELYVPVLHSFCRL